MAARILLAKDNALNQNVAQLVLKRAGYSIDAVWDGNEAMEACSSQDSDIVLMDCQIPQMDGLEATRQIPN